MAAKRKINTGKMIARLNERQRKAFWCADGECLEQMLVSQNVRLAGSPEKFIDYVMNQKHNWQIISFVFLNDGIKNYYQSLIFESFGNVTELQEVVNKEVVKMIDAQNPNHLVSWGWWGSPAGDLDPEKIEEQALDLFSNSGAWDANRCENVMLIRKIKSA